MAVSKEKNEKSLHIRNSVTEAKLNQYFPGENMLEFLSFCRAKYQSMSSWLAPQYPVKETM